MQQVLDAAIVPNDQSQQNPVRARIVIEQEGESTNNSNSMEVSTKDSGKKLTIEKMDMDKLEGITKKKRKKTATDHKKKIPFHVGKKGRRRP